MVGNIRHYQNQAFFKEHGATASLSLAALFARNFYLLRTMTPSAMNRAKSQVYVNSWIGMTSRLSGEGRLIACLDACRYSGRRDVVSCG